MLLRKNRLLVATALSVLLCSSLILPVKAEATMWDKTYGGQATEDCVSAIETSDGGYAIAIIPTKASCITS